MDQSINQSIYTPIYLIIYLSIDQPKSKLRSDTKMDNQIGICDIIPFFNPSINQLIYPCIFPPVYLSAHPLHPVASRYHLTPLPHSYINRLVWSRLFLFSFNLWRFTPCHNLQQEKRKRKTLHRACPSVDNEFGASSYHHHYGTLTL